MKISNSLKSLLKNLIDYAGLFPPAKLNLDEALNNYLSYIYIKSDLNFALSKFIIPISRLNEAGELIKNSELYDPPFNLSLICSPSTGIDESREKFMNDLEMCRNFSYEFKKNVLLNSFEFRLNDDFFDSVNVKSGKISEFFRFVQNNLNENLISDSDSINTSDAGKIIFYECNIKNEAERNTQILIDSISNCNLIKPFSGFKLRTGGLTPVDFPDSELIAFCIRKCLDTKVPMKFTAGLHHPFRHFDESIGAKMHGFINVFGAGITAMRHDISDKEMVELLNDEDPDNFKFTDDYFAWKDWETETDDIEFARKALVLSYGSCSFDEPIDDLKSLNLIQ